MWITPSNLKQSGYLYQKLAVSKLFALKMPRFTLSENKKKKKTNIPHFVTLRKHTYSNILKISPTKTENFQIKILIFFYISAQNIDCGYSYEYPQSMFLSRNKKNNLYPGKPQFYYMKVGFKWFKII